MRKENIATQRQTLPYRLVLIVLTLERESSLQKREQETILVFLGLIITVLSPARLFRLYHSDSEALLCAHLVERLAC